MGRPRETVPDRRPPPGRADVVCLGAGIWLVAFVFLAVLVDTRVFYEAGPWFPCFSLDRSFCWQTLLRPGGAVGLADAFLAQLDAYGWPSAAVLATVLTALAMGLGYLADKAVGRAPLPWVLLGAALVLASFGRYGRHGAPLLGLTLALAAAALHTARHPRSRGGRMAQFVVLAVAVYCLAAGPVAAFILFAAASEFHRFRDQVLGGLMLLVGASIPLLVGIAGFGLPLGPALAHLLPMYAPTHYEGSTPLTLLYAALVVLAASAVLGAAPGRGGRPRPRPSSRQGLAGWAGRHRRLAATLAAALALAAVVAALDRQRGQEMRLRRAAREEDWTAVLALAPRLTGRGPAIEIIYAVNQALLHTGGLLDAMFCFPQASLGLTLGMGIDIRTPAEVVELRRWLCFDLGETTLELGLVNEAEHEACEMLTELGPHPTILLRLARIFTVKGNLPAAEHALNALAKDIVHARSARAWLSQLRGDPTAAETAAWAAIRRHRVTTDSFDVGVDIPRRCELLLDADPQNRLAVDCLIGQYLLERDLTAVARELGRLREAGYTALPRHVQEAVILQEMTQQSPVDCQGWSIGPERRAAYQAFAAALQPYYAAGDTRAARQALAPRFGDSYFYYYACGGSPEAPQE